MEPTGAPSAVLLSGLHFEPFKAFLLPESMPGVKALQDKLAHMTEASVLVVGHSDRAGNEADNLALSRDRAQGIAAFLHDDVEAWPRWDDDDQPARKPWGLREDQYLLSWLRDGSGPDAFYRTPTHHQDNPRTPTPPHAFPLSHHS